MIKDKGDRLRSAGAVLWLFWWLLAIIFIGELFVMLLLPILLPGAERVVVNFADSILLTIIIAPFIWVLISKRKEAEERIRRLNTELVLNIDKLKKAQEELVRKEKLATIGQVADNIGRELRNTLGGVSNAVYFLKSRMPDADADVKEYLEIIRHEVDNSVQLIVSLLDFAWPKAPIRSLVAVEELVDEALGECRVPDNICVSINIPGDLPQAGIDRMQIGQVLQNIVNNAVQAMPKGGALRVAARLAAGKGLGSGKRGVESSSVTNGDFAAPNPDSRIPIPEVDFIEISVADTGEGIPSENMEQIFQPLFTSKARGIGLGLAVARKLAEQNGGRIEAQSEVGKGTTLRVVLPVHAPTVREEKQ